ncbi:MAG: hypothetical protein IJL02_06750 [Methanobrevibacter sp.]|uniref:hypothetical protein n=1 Tax=Methanobrevibacter sp. TaxID=66852 RepID=UPI0025FE7F07|nr:hypothetical protein [Methanobrevibacter sp.]MBQ6099544.1 hypothetical protein [Methanobrevibacter sp.]
MNKLTAVLLVIVLIIVAALASTIVSPVLIIAEDAEEGTPGVDMAASFSMLGGFQWVYPGSSYNANGETLHNIHLIDPDNPYGAAKDIMEYTYHYSPHIIIGVNNAGAEAIFGGDIIDNTRANDAYNGYAGSANVQGTMSRGDALGTAMSNANINFFEIPLQVLMGNIQFHFV